MSTLTLSSAAFAGLLSDTLTAAGKDGSLPLLVGVRLYTVTGERDETLLVGTATDRFVAIQAHVPVDEGALDTPIWLTREQIGQVLAITRPYRTGRRGDHGQVEIEVVNRTITVRQVGLNELGSIEAKFEMADHKLPDLAKIFTESRKRATSTDPVGVDGAKLARLARLANADDRPMVIRNTGGTRPIEISIGKSILAILMPVRLGEERLLPVPIHAVPVMDQTEAEAAA